MDIKKKTNIEISTEGYMHDGQLKTHPAKIGDWWGEEIAEWIDFEKVINELEIPSGKYKISIKIEEIDD